MVPIRRKTGLGRARGDIPRACSAAVVRHLLLGIAGGFRGELSFLCHCLFCALTMRLTERESVSLGPVGVARQQSSKNARFGAEAAIHLAGSYARILRRVTLSAPGKCRQ